MSGPAGSPAQMVVLAECRPGQGVLFVDEGTNVVFANRVAGAMLAEADGIAIVAGALHPADPAQAVALRRLARAVARGESPASAVSFAVERPSRRRPYGVTVLPLRAPPGWAAASVAVVLIRDPDRATPPSAAHLQCLLGLTPAEAALAIEIMRGDGLQAAAAALRIGLATARTHLQRVFAKTGTHRQAELVRLAADLPAALGFDALHPVATTNSQAPSQMMCTASHPDG